MSDRVNISPTPASGNRNDKFKDQLLVSLQDIAASDGRGRGEHDINMPWPRHGAKYVQFHPHDDPTLYPSIFFAREPLFLHTKYMMIERRAEDPDNFTPYKDWLGRMKWWGVQSVSILSPSLGVCVASDESCTLSLLDRSSPWRARIVAASITTSM